MIARMSSTSKITSYEEARANHHWEVPERFNIAREICERHPRDKRAMVHEDPAGNVRNVNWGELQDASSAFANVISSA